MQTHTLDTPSLYLTAQHHTSQDGGTLTARRPESALPAAASCCVAWGLKALSFKPETEWRLYGRFYTEFLPQLPFEITTIKRKWAAAWHAHVDRRRPVRVLLLAQLLPPPHTKHQSAVTCVKMCFDLYLTRPQSHASVATRISKNSVINWQNLFTPQKINL